MSTNTAFDNNFVGKFSSEYEKFKEETKFNKPSVIVLGGTGVGKSTLINLVFKKEIAKAGAGEPVTRGINKYDNKYITIYDSEGYETTDAASHSEYINMINNFITKLNEQHEGIIIWYCISAPSARVTDIDLDLIKAAKSISIPLAIVLTQVDSADDDQINAIETVLQEHFKNIQIFESSINEEAILSEEKGLDALYQWSIDHLEEAYKTAFIGAANRDLERKDNDGTNIVYQHSATAAAICLVPLPAADAAGLVPCQVSMLGRLFFLWDIPLAAGMAGMAIEAVMPTIGRMIAGNIIKLIPGIGSAIGGAINATIAASLTYGLGIAANKACKYVVENQLQGKIININDIFNSTDFVEQIKTFAQAYKPQNK